MPMSERATPTQIDVTFVRMGQLEFVLQDQHFPVERLVAHQVCDALTYDPQTNQLFVKSAVRGDVLRLFISAVNLTNGAVMDW
jgi:hypothetical protein